MMQILATVNQTSKTSNSMREVFDKIYHKLLVNFL